MNTRTLLLYATFAGLMALIVLMVIPYAGQDELMNAPTPSPAQPDQPSFNPSYGDLTDEQVQIADRAIGDLLNSVEGLNPSLISVKSFEAQEFGNTSLGCPQPGQMYAEVITPGYRIVLEAQGQEYDYRLDTADTVMLCTN